MKRNEFLKKGVIALASIPFVRLDVSNESRKSFSAVRFGLCADIHHDFYPDVPKKLQLFIDEMKQRNPDFIGQLGDFCTPKPENKIIMDIWKEFKGQSLHVLGNHDIEMQYSQKEAADFWGIPDPYYSKDIKGYHIIVLDGNDVSPVHNKRVAYEQYIGSKQLDWLKEDLDSTDLYTIIFCHQPIDVGLDNSLQVRNILDEANRKCGFQKVQLVFSGHWHKDFYNNINGIHYFQINSMCYDYTGSKHGDDSPFSPEVRQKYTLLKNMSHYKDPLWAFVEITKDGVVKLTGRKSQFLGSSPYDKGLEHKYNYESIPQISDRRIKMTRTLHNENAFSSID